MKKYIAATAEVKEFLAKDFKVNIRTVRNALSYVYKTGLGGRIRKRALEKGAVRMVTTEEIECIFDSDGVMTQLLPNGAIIEADKNSGVLTVYFKGVPMIVVDNPRLSEIPAIQKSALVLK